MNKELRKAVEELRHKWAMSKGGYLTIFDWMEVNEALAATEQSEPVAWMVMMHESEAKEYRAKGYHVEPYTSPPKHEPLSDDDIREAAWEAELFTTNFLNMPDEIAISFARAIEKAVKGGK